MLVFGFFITSIKAQENKEGDTIHLNILNDITVVGRNSKNDYQKMPEIVGTNIYAGKKSTLIVVENVQGNIVSNTMRQVLAKVPGIHIWESDPSGTQIGIAARGLSPNRSWEFNIRQNGYDISADPFGYPEAYYNPQLQAVQRIEVLRGQGSLQYGPQFGGLVNYILRNGSEIKKKLEFEVNQTLGSNGLFNSFSAIGGKTNKIHYYTFFDHKNGNGWRENSSYKINSGFATITYYFSPKFYLTTEIMRSNNNSQQAGGLTDLQFNQNPQQSFRNRNWFDITWTTPALIANYQINKSTTWNTKIYSTIGERNSVGFLQSITIKDTINSITNNFNNRNITIDNYRNYGFESRILTNYKIGKMNNTFSGGVRFYTGTTFRKADGKGTTGSDYDITIIGSFPKNIEFKSSNVAIYFESIFRISDKLLIIPGIRYEWLKGAASGRNGFSNSGTEILLQNVERSRRFLLAGIGAEYHITKSTELYSNITQAYRPIQFANLQAPPTTDIIDPDLKDANGYNLDLGFRGKLNNFLQFDVSAFYLLYNNRVGTISQLGSTNKLITNVGASVSKGFEGFAELNLVNFFRLNKNLIASAFGSYSFTNATYSSNHKDGNTRGKKVENAPANIFRGGISTGFKNLLLTMQISYVDKTYSDATNTEMPTFNGQNGIAPSYIVTDLTASFQINKKQHLKAGINNLSNTFYFTRRSSGYPGPGVLPADGRTFFVSIGFKL